MSVKQKPPAVPARDDSPVSMLVDRSQYVPHLLNILNNRISSGASDLYIRRFGVGINEWRLLSVIARYPGCIVTFAAGKMEVHKGIVSRALQSLAEGGHLRVEPQGKEKLIYLTTAGKRLYEAIVRVALEREKLLLKGFTEERKAMLLDLLRQLMANADAMNDHFNAPPEP